MEQKKVKPTTKRKSKKKTSKIRNIIIILIVIVLIVFIVNKAQERNHTKDEMSLIIDNQDVTSQLENKIMIQDYIIYISFDDIKKCLDETIYYEEESNLVITSGDKKIAALEIDNRDIEINGSDITIEGQALKTEEGIIYIPVSELENVYDIEYSYIESTKSVVIDYYYKKMEKAYTNKNVSIKSEKSKFSKTVAKVEKGNWVVFVSEENGWAKVRTQDGILGYVKKKNLTNFVTQREDMEEAQNNVDEKYLEEDITKEKIETYAQRKKLIEETLQKAVSKEYKTIKFVYNRDDENYERFKIETTQILKECGIRGVFE